MNIGLSDRIRQFAKSRYVSPAIREGKSHFLIRVKDVNNELKAEGFPSRHTPQICDALTGRKFLRENGLEIEKVEGPPSGQSPTVVVHYRVEEPGQLQPVEGAASRKQDAAPTEDPTERAHRLTEQIRGLLKDELAAYGGGEAFLRWIRSEDEDEA
jgi:hypothetical protein